MTKEELWKVYCDKNPKFADSEAQITLTARGIKKLFEQTYDTAHTRGIANGRALELMRKPKTGSGVDDILKSLFK